jgi:hypothetical protein
VPTTAQIVSKHTRPMPGRCPSSGNMLASRNCTSAEERHGEKAAGPPRFAASWHRLNMPETILVSAWRAPEVRIPSRQKIQDCAGKAALGTGFQAGRLKYKLDEQAHFEMEAYQMSGSLASAFSKGLHRRSPCRTRPRDVPSKQTSDDTVTARDCGPPTYPPRDANPSIFGFPGSPSRSRIGPLRFSWTVMVVRGSSRRG